MESSTFPVTPAEQFELPQLDPREIDIYCWRVEQLERAGYSGALAHLLAQNTEVDLHLACQLMARGAGEQTAYAILA
jgi:hypothetical protein